MKLAALGVATAGIGLVLSIPGLIGVGAFWIAMGVPARHLGHQLKELRAGGKSAVDGRTFAKGTLFWLVLGAPSLAVGVLTIGIDAGDESWRWLPIVVGGWALGIGGVSAAMYLAGTAVLAVSENQAAKIPATLWIRAVRETGTFVNERPRLEFELTVEPDPATGLASYDVTKKATVPFTALAYARIGDGFKALVAGVEDPTSMEILWDEPVSRTDPTQR